jgi:hypothetical protein
MGFVGIGRPEEFRTVTRAHVLAWRKDLEGRELSGTTIRRKLAARSVATIRIAGSTVRARASKRSSATSAT